MSTFRKSLYFFAQLIEVGRTPEGYLTITTTGFGESSSPLGGFEGVTQWVEVAPLRFAEVNGLGKVAFMADETGAVTHLVSGQGYHSVFAKVQWYETQPAQVAIIAIAAVALLTLGIAVFILWLPRFIARLVRRRPAGEPLAAIALRLWGGLVTQALALQLLQVIGVLYAFDTVAGLPNFVWGDTPEIVDALNSAVLPAVLAFTLPFAAALAWFKGWWRPAFRVVYTLGALGALAAVWWGAYWNLIGY